MHGEFPHQAHQLLLQSIDQGNGDRLCPGPNQSQGGIQFIDGPHRLKAGIRLGQSLSKEEVRMTVISAPGHNTHGASSTRPPAN